MLPNKALQLTGISVALRAPSKPAAERRVVRRTRRFYSAEFSPQGWFSMQMVDVVRVLQAALASLRDVEAAAEDDAGRCRAVLARV